MFHLTIANANFFLGRDGLHRLIAAFTALHQYLIEKELHKLTDGTLKFEVNLLIRQNNQPIFGYINDCKEASYKADSATKKLPLSILNAMIDLILKIEDNLGEEEEWVGYGEMFEKFLKFFGSHEYIQLLMNIFTQEDDLKVEFHERASAAAAASTNQQTFNLNAELHCDLTLDPDQFKDFFRRVLSGAQMHPALIDNMEHHFAWKRKQLGEGQEIPPTKITAFELTDALHQLWTYHLIATLHQQLSSLNASAIMLLGLPLNEQACFDMSEETFFRLFATVPNPAKLTTLPGLSGSRTTQNQWQSEILAHLNRSLGGEGYRQGDGDNLGLSSKALNAITLCLANFLDKEVSKSLQLFLSTTASCQDEAMHTLQCIYAFFGTYLIQFELVFDTRKLTSKDDRVKWASGDVISTAFAVKLLDAALKHVTDDGFVSQNDSVESRFVPDPHINLHIHVNLSFGTTSRTFQVNGRGSGCFVATCLNLKAALSRVFQPVQHSSFREQARGLWLERWGFDFSEPQLLGGMVMNYASQEGISTNLNIGLGFIARGFVNIGFAHLDLSELGVGVDGLALNHATEEDDDEGRSAPGDGDDSVSDQGQEGNSAEESSSPSRGKSIDLLRSRKRPPNDSNAASDAAGKRKRSGEETAAPHQQEERKKSGRKSSSGKGDKKNKTTDFLLNQLGYMHEKGLLDSVVLESAVRKCGSDPENYESQEHSQKFENWMWSNVEHLLDCGNGNGNGNGNGDGEVLGADLFFNKPLRGLNIEAAAKGKGKAQRQGADDDTSSSSSSMNDPYVAAAKGKGKAQSQTGADDDMSMSSSTLQNIMGMDGEISVSDYDCLLNNHELNNLDFNAWSNEDLGYANTEDANTEDSSV